ncbi:tRNA pseudouridine(38-40) synthase TruA [Catenulispora sp. NL8]|uniref:tRNA pseudouridine synthase A n=2 Tax=Catenulispora pinistramenti TaxID=2705254 RepID=A0ABS5L209_9ACTN|nr:tRNA pseudouridine(38-40) synthase TruA [Catenulispora pinistramenti]MBS2552289.1 tRNA pseudouridine(38-40) synthase TruA [Catenulispora pinistramenti]
MSTEPPPGHTRIRLDLAYDGTRFSGWAMQPGRRTVCGELTSALSTVLRQPVTLVVAGRTDAGVHASGQVAQFDVPVELWAEHEERLLRRLAAVLPADVRVWSAVVAPAGFDARFAAMGRRYAYRVTDAAYGPHPLRRNDVTWHPRAVDPVLMNEAAAGLLGEHDFASFCKKREGATTIRCLKRLVWTREAPTSLTPTGLLVADVRADAFCHSMVRSLVGALLAVGEGRRPVGDPGRILAERVRSPEVKVAPPEGLTLEEVVYPPDAELAAQQQKTRRIRVLESD